MAAELGKRLLGEVEEVGFGEILHALRLQDGSQPKSTHFGFPPFDRLLRATTEGRPQPTKTPPMVELMSLHAGGGATHLLYHLTALTVLPQNLGGKQSCAIVLDTDNTFNVSRLVAQLRLVATQHERPREDSSITDEEVLQALRHVHIFRPQSLASLTATLNSLSSYLFTPTRHFSFDRKVAFIALDSASAFYWQDRAETEDAAFYAKTSTFPAAEAPQQSGYVAVAAALKEACAALQSPAILTSWNPAPVSTAPHTSRSFRPSLPVPFSALPVLRMACQRVPIKKFPPLISVEGSMREAEDRWKAVEEGRFECFVNECGVDERTLRRMEGQGSGFEFKVREEGVVVRGEQHQAHQKKSEIERKKVAV